MAIQVNGKVRDQIQVAFIFPVDFNDMALSFGRHGYGNTFGQLKPRGRFDDYGPARE